MTVVRVLRLRVLRGGHTQVVRHDQEEMSRGGALLPVPR